MRRALAVLAASAVLAVVPVNVVPVNAVAGGSSASPQGTGRCAVWHEKTIAFSLGILESLLPDNRGGMLLSSTSHNAIERLRPNGKVTTVVSASSPGELVWHGSRVMFPTGDDVEDGAASRADGTLQLLNLTTKKLTTYATGLTMPNGLVIAKNGEAYVTRDTGSGTGITRIGPGPHHHVMTNWSKLSDTNGIAINRKTHTMYVDRTFTKNAPIVAIPLGHPARARQVADLAPLGSSPVKGLDDLTMARNGVLYLPANIGGELFSFNPATGTACLIASKLGNPSDVTIGTGHGWRKGALFVSGFDGKVREFYK